MINEDVQQQTKTTNSFLLIADNDLGLRKDAYDAKQFIICVFEDDGEQ